MQHETGHVWQVQWSNPYTSPPDGMPRLLAEMFVPRDGADSDSRCPLEISSFHRPKGYTVYATAIRPPLRPLPPERLARLRRQRLERRERAKRPLFADEFIEQALALKPDYYSGTDVCEAREAVLAYERERYEYLTSHSNELLVYWRGERGE